MVKPAVTIYGTLVQATMERIDTDLQTDQRLAAIVAPAHLDEMRQMIHDITARAYCHGLQDGFVQGVQREADYTASVA